jgi:hypothetical protein
MQGTRPQLFVIVQSLLHKLKPRPCRSRHTTMSDNDLATRAPESDLAEQSAIPGDTVVDQGASLGVSLL